MTKIKSLRRASSKAAFVPKLALLALLIATRYAVEEDNNNGQDLEEVLPEQQSTSTSNEEAGDNQGQGDQDEVTEQHLKYLTKLLKERPEQIEYFICSATLQTNKARGLLKVLSDQLQEREEEIPEQVKNRILDKIFIKASLTCTERFKALSPEDKVREIRETLTRKDREHLTKFFDVDAQAVLVEGNFNLTKEEAEYRQTIEDLRQLHHKREQEIKREKEAQQQQPGSQYDLNELVKTRTELAAKVEDLVKFAKSDKLIHFSIGVGALASLLLTALCHCLCCRGPDLKKEYEGRIRRLKDELYRDKVVYKKQSEKVYDAEKRLLETVKGKYGVKSLDEFLEKKEHLEEPVPGSSSDEHPEVPAGGDEGEENLKNRKEGGNNNKGK